MSCLALLGLSNLCVIWAQLLWLHIPLFSYLLIHIVRHHHFRFCEFHFRTAARIIQLSLRAFHRCERSILKRVSSAKMLFINADRYLSQLNVSLPLAQRRFRKADVVQEESFPAYHMQRDSGRATGLLEVQKNAFCNRFRNICCKSW